ncbi:MAG: DUF2304 domain-containing protein [Planctomycetota bacterium]|nr:DUF2304 domain-containing protein [Planctomycetota bacterium]
MIAAKMLKDITIHHQVLPLTAAVLIALVTIELVRRRKLREEYAMLWIAASAVLLVFAIFPRLLWYVSGAIGLVYHTTMIILCFSFLSLVVIHLSVIISRNSEDTRQMAQRIAMLERELEELRGGPVREPASEHEDRR